jgi:hypothetical protein
LIRWITKEYKVCSEGKGLVSLYDCGRLSKNQKDHTEIEFDSIGYASARNAENRTKLKTIVRSLSNNKKLCLAYFN